MFGYVEIIILGITLAVDASIVAFSYGLCMKPWRLHNGFRIALVTSTFQFIMPFIGWFAIWFASERFSHYAGVIDHWITFVIFLLLGFKIIKDSNSNEDKQKLSKNLSLWILLIIGIATSIDALAAGVLIFSQNESLGMSASLIGVITFICVFLAYIASKTFYKIPSHPLEIIAGCILILLGFKVLLDHTLWYPTL